MRDQAISTHVFAIAPEEMRPDAEKNLDGYPFVRASLRTNSMGLHIEYWIWHAFKGELVRRRTFKLVGETDAQKRQHAKNLIKDINHGLFIGKMVGGNELRDAMKATKRSKNKEEKEQVTTVKMAFEKALEIKVNQVSKRSQERYRNFMNVWSDWADPAGVNKKNIKALTRNHVLEFLDYVQSERKVANKTRNGFLGVCITYLNELVSRNLIEKSPAAGIKKLPEKGMKNIPYTTGQQARLENYLKKSDYQLFLYTRFIYYGFLRPVEILRLKVKDVDLQKGIILVRSHVSKNKQQMPVVITEGLKPFIMAMELHKLSPGMFLFGKDLEPGFDSMLRNRVSERHTKAMKACDVYDGEVTMYSWKHTGNCNAYRAGADIKALQYQNRHSSLEMTDIYLQSLGLTQQYKLRKLMW